MVKRCRLFPYCEITGKYRVLLGEWSTIHVLSADYLCISIQTLIQFKSLKLLMEIF